MPPFCASALLPSRAPLPHQVHHQVQQTHFITCSLGTSRAMQSVHCRACFVSSTKTVLQSAAWLQIRATSIRSNMLVVGLQGGCGHQYVACTVCSSFLTIRTRCWGQRCQAGTPCLTHSTALWAPLAALPCAPGSRACLIRLTLLVSLQVRLPAFRMRTPETPCFTFSLSFLSWGESTDNQ